MDKESKIELIRKADSLGQAFWETMEGVNHLADMVKGKYAVEEYYYLSEKTTDKQLKLIVEVELEKIKEKIIEFDIDNKLSDENSLKRIAIIEKRLREL